MNWLICLMLWGTSVPPYTHQLVSVYDGDTFTVLSASDCQKRKIRLAGVDAPEIRGSESGATEARDHLRAIVLNQKISIQATSRSFDRLVGVVETQAGEQVNLAMRSFVGLPRAAKYDDKMTEEQQKLLGF